MEEGISLEEFTRAVEADDKQKDMVRRFGDVREQVQALRRDGLPKGVSSGWPELDDYYRIPLGQWTLVTGIPGHGKSSFLNALSVNLMANEGWKFLVFSAENLPMESYAARLMACYLGKPFHHGSHERLTAYEVEHGVDFLDAHCRFIDPGLDAPRVDDILNVARDEMDKDPYQGLIMDPWNEMDHCSTKANSTETNVIGEELGHIRRSCRTMNMHAWVVAHPQKMQRIPGSETNAYHVPTAYDVSGSAHFRNKADFSLTIHRPEAGSRLTDVYVQKVRFHENGQLGKVQFSFDPMTGRFSSSAAET